MYRNDWLNVSIWLTNTDMHLVDFLVYWLLLIDLSNLSIPKWIINLSIPNGLLTSVSLIDLLT